MEGEGIEDWKKEGWKFRRTRHGRLEGMDVQKRDRGLEGMGD